LHPGVHGVLGRGPLLPADQLRLVSGTSGPGWRRWGNSITVPVSVVFSLSAGRRVLAETLMSAPPSVPNKVISGTVFEVIQEGVECRARDQPCTLKLRSTARIHGVAWQRLDQHVEHIAEPSDAVRSGAPVATAAFRFSEQLPGGGAETKRPTKPPGRSVILAYWLA
jgi:hypothetical protein